MAVIEIVTFPCTDAFVEDQTKFAPTAGSKPPGCLEVYHAVEKNNDKNVGCLTAVWESYEAHKALMAQPNYNQTVKTALAPVVAGTLEHLHVQNLVGELDGALSAPVTEICTFKVKEGASTADALGEQVAALGNLLRPSTFGVAWGDCIEHPGTFVALLGWSSVEAHVAAAHTEQALAIIVGMQAIADVGYKHYPFAKY